MRRSVKPPKTFTLYARDRNGKSGYVRFRGYSNDRGNITYEPFLVGRRADASVYVRLERLKIEAKRIKEEYSFESIEIVDDATRKHHVIQ